MQILLPKQNLLHKTKPKANIVTRTQLGWDDLAGGCIHRSGSALGMFFLQYVV